MKTKPNKMEHEDNDDYREWYDPNSIDLFEMESEDGMFDFEKKVRWMWGTPEAGEVWIEIEIMDTFPGQSEEVY